MCMCRSMYTYNTPGAFVPHSAINLSVKSNEAQPTTSVSSLDLSISESGNINARLLHSTNYLNASDSVSFTAPNISGTTAKTTVSSQNAVPSPHVLDLTRPLLRYIVILL